MTDNNKVVWSEGLFLRTQHFQQQDRHTEWMMRHALQAVPMQTFGFFQLSLDEAALTAGMIGLSQAEGIFPDGTMVSIPQTSLSAETVAIKSDLDAGLIHLAVPSIRPGAVQIDASHDTPSGSRYHGSFVNVIDTIRGGADPTDIEIARLVPRLLLPKDKIEGYITMPIARVEGLNADGSVALDAGFIAPALRIGAIPIYEQFLKELVAGLDRISDAHGGIVLDGTGASMENLAILELANSVRPRVAHLMAQNNQHPSELFMELAGLAGRMATYGASSRRLAELAPYDHINPQHSFGALVEVIRSMVLSLRHVEPSSRALEVQRYTENVWMVRIDNPELLTSSRLVLRIGGDMSEDMLRKFFVDQATVGPVDTFDDLWTSKLPGISLKPLHTQPREIPYDGDRLCLELDRSSEHWGKLSQAGGFAVGVAGKLEREPDIDCYIVSR
ncbi:MAG: type VI secretion system baseplate subunit TssK [Litoreibacter sp.]